MVWAFPFFTHMNNLMQMPHLSWDYIWLGDSRQFYRSVFGHCLFQLQLLCTEHTTSVWSQSQSEAAVLWNTVEESINWTMLRPRMCVWGMACYMFVCFELFKLFYLQCHLCTNCEEDGPNPQEAVLLSPHIDKHNLFCFLSLRIGF